jgi:transposase
VPQLPSPADQAAEIARLKRDLDRTRMERDVLKNCRGPAGRLWRIETLRRYLAARRVAAVSLLEAQSPLKNVVHGSLRT